MRVRARPLVFLALGCFAFYLGWNAYWLGRGMLPPSILKGVFGIPAPTTGFTRSCLALARGDVAASLRWNAFTVPIVTLYGVSFAVFLRGLVRRRRTVIPTWMVAAWAIFLAAAWITKLLQGRAWW